MNIYTLMDFCLFAVHEGPLLDEEIVFIREFSRTLSGKERDVVTVEIWRCVMKVMTPNQAIDKGLEFLACRQLPTGQFPVEMTFPYNKEALPQQDQSIFSTSQIVYALGFLPYPTAEVMISRALSYFQSEMSGHGLWRFWNKTAKSGAQKLFSFIPADLDDMACVSLVLQHHGVDFPDNRPLILLNRNRAGLFYTWLVLRPIPTANLLYWRTILAEITLPRYSVFWTTTAAGYNDVDAVVNANVLLYLGDSNETRPIVDWLIQIAQNGDEANCDKWYRDLFTFYYALSRCYHAGVQALGCVRSHMLSRLLEAAQPEGQIGEHVLHTALAANTLLNFGGHSPELANSINFLLRTQCKDGSWEAGPYYHSGPKKEVSWGSAELTTSLCLEALHRFQYSADPSFVCC
jgi:hypothetical protein